MRPDLCEFVQGAKSFHPRVFKGTFYSNVPFSRNVLSAGRDSFVRSVPALPAACAAYPTASRDDLALATPACLSRLLAPYVVAGASAVLRCHNALGCDRSLESRGGKASPEK